MGEGAERETERERGGGGSHQNGYSRFTFTGCVSDDRPARQSSQRIDRFLLRPSPFVPSPSRVFAAKDEVIQRGTTALSPDVKQERN